MHLEASQQNIEGGKAVDTDCDASEETVKYVTIRTRKLYIRLSRKALDKLLAGRAKDKKFRQKLLRLVRIRTDIADQLVDGEFDRYFALLEKKIKTM